MKHRANLLMLFAIITTLTFCKKNDDNHTSGPQRLQLVFTESYLSDNDSVYIMLSDLNGNFIEGQYQTGPGTIIFSFNGEVYLTWVPCNTYNFEANTIYVNSSNKYTLFDYGDQPQYLGDTYLSYINLPTIKNGSYLIASTNNDYDIGFDQVCYPSSQLSVYLPSEKCYIKLQKSDGNASYKIINIFPNSFIDVDWSNPLPLTKKTISVTSDLKYMGAALYSSSPTSETTLNGNMLDLFSSGSETNQIDLFYPDGLFKSYITHFYAHNEDCSIIKGAEIRGAIPSHLEPTSNELALEEEEWPQCTVQTSGNYDLLQINWRGTYYNTWGSYLYMYWHLYAPSGIKTVTMPQLPSAFTDNHPVDLSSLTPYTAEIIDYAPGFGYSDYLSKSWLCQAESRQRVSYSFSERLYTSYKTLKDKAPAKPGWIPGFNHNPVTLKRNK